MNAAPTSEELVALYESGKMAGEILGWSRLKGAEAQTIETQCVALHNSGSIDLFQLVEDDVFQALKGPNFFSASRFFCKLIPELEATPARVMACIEALVAGGDHDMFANLPNAAFRTWCEKDPDRAREVISASLDGDDQSSRHLTFALEAINEITEARDIALTYDGKRCLSAVTALGRINDDDPFSRAETFAVFGTLLDRGIDDTLRSNLLGSMGAILERTGEVASPEEAGLVERLLVDAGDFTVHQAAQMLLDNCKILEPGIIACLLEVLERVNPANKRTLSVLDHGLEALLELGHDEAAIGFVTKLLSGSDNSIELNELASFTSKLLSGPPDHLSRAVVRWLLIGGRRLCDGIATALRTGDLAGPPLNLLADDLAISPMTQLFICRKAIGWLFLKPTTAASVLVSVLRVCDSKMALEVQQLLVEPLLINYHGVREYLEGLASDDVAKERANQALAQYETYMKALQEVPQIKELGPSEHHRRIERLRMSDLMQNAHKQAQSQSLFLNLVKRSVLLYGNNSLNFVKDGEGGLRPMEMNLKPYGVSFEMPRMEIVDPVGLDYMLRVFRNERIAQ